MKIRYIKNYTDEFEQYFPAGCVADHTESDCMARIALGVAEITDQEARLRIVPLEQQVQTECVVDNNTADEVTTVTKAKK